MPELRERWFGPDSGDRYQLVLIVLISLLGTPVVAWVVATKVDSGALFPLVAGTVLLGITSIVVRGRLLLWMPAIAAGYLAVLVAFTGGLDSHLPITFLLIVLTSAFLHETPAFVANLLWALAMATLPFFYDRASAVPSQDAERGVVTALVLLAAVIVVHVLSQVLSGRNERLQSVLDQQRAVIAQLEEAQEAKDLFLSALSHELRTPLTSIMGIGQTLQQHDDRLEAARRADLLDRLVANGERLHRLLTDLLDLRRLQEGATDLDLSPVHLPGLVESALGDVDRRACAVQTEVPETTVNLDVSKVERIITNLVANACKHTPSGSSVWVRLVVEPDALHISVADDGDGVPDHLKLSVFEPFQQGPHSRDDPSPGTGVGLSIVDRFARLHGGSAWVEDRPGGGAVFHVRLAVQQARRTRSGAGLLARRSLHADERMGDPGQARPQERD